VVTQKEPGSHHPVKPEVTESVNLFPTAILVAGILTALTGDVFGVSKNPMLFLLASAVVFLSLKMIGTASARKREVKTRTLQVSCPHCGRQIEFQYSETIVHVQAAADAVERRARSA
jgi:hypothetical protein